jgi:nucleoside-diphosphate-sugar epimerase
MQVFLTGATGYIGSAVADALRAAGHGIVALARSEQSAAALAERGFEVFREDLHNAARIAEASRAAGAFVHAAIADDANAPLLEAALVREVISRFERSDRPFLYTSGVWVMGSTGGETADENWPPDPLPLLAWRAAVEQTVLEAASRGVRSVVIRPAMVYGRGGGTVALMVNSARENGMARYLEEGSTHWSLVHVDDLADLYVRALEKGAPGSLYIAAAGKAVRVRDIAAAASRAAGAEGRTQSWRLEEALQVLGPWVEALTLDQQVSSEKARRELGWEPHRPSIFEELEGGSYTDALPARGSVFAPLDPSINR